MIHKEDEEVQDAEVERLESNEGNDDEKDPKDVSQGVVSNKSNELITTLHYNDKEPRNNEAYTQRTENTE